MNILLTILLILAGIIILLLIIALFSRKDYFVEREEIIEKPVATVFQYVKQLKNQDYFNKWAMIDPNMSNTYTGTDGTVGFVWAWDSQNKSAGKGEQEIKKITEGEKVDMEIRFIKPFTGVADVYMKTEPVSPGKTKVKWGMKSAMKYPMNILLVLTKMEKMLGDDLQESLSRLKKNLEK